MRKFIPLFVCFIFIFIESPRATLLLEKHFPPPLKVKVQDMALGEHHSCVLILGKVKCWGRNHLGQLGHGHTHDWGDDQYEMGFDLPVVDLGTDYFAVAIGAGENHNCALLNSGLVKCWGGNHSGQLGLNFPDFSAVGSGKGHYGVKMGDDLPAVDLGTGRTATAIAVGWRHTCALLDNGGVKCWGRNTSGQLGLGDSYYRGAWGYKRPSQMGDALPEIELGTGRKAVAITAGSSHTCALLDNGKAKCWGTNFMGQLGLGDISKLERHPDPNGNGLMGVELGDNPGEMGDNLPYIDIGQGLKIKSISAKRFRTCVVLSRGRIKCWGHNDYGQLGLGLDGGIDVGAENNEMGDDLPFINLGSGRRAESLALGKGHTCALLTPGRVKCWGRNHKGQLGVGDRNPRGYSIGDMGDYLHFVFTKNQRLIQEVVAGGGHTCALFKDGDVKCWGDNEYGQLGLEFRGSIRSAPDGLEPINLGNI